MLRNILTLSIALTLSAGLARQAFSQDDVERTLSRAESLYFEARFNESIQLLSQVNESLRAQSGRAKEKTAAKFQLALANIGLNNPSSAKSYLMEIYAINPEFAVDAQQYSPKVIALANEAKAEQSVVRCKAAVDDARKSLNSGDSVALLSLLRSMKPRCAELAAVEPEAAELLFKKGLSEYKQGMLPGALQSFRAAVSLAPKHELATQYLELAQSKLQVAGDRVLLDWQKNFQSKEYRQAAAVYRQIASFKDAGTEETLDMMRAEYLKVLDPLVESYNRVCSGGDTVKGSQIRDQIAEVIPEPSVGSDLRSKMVSCAPPAPVVPPVPETRVAAASESRSAPVNSRPRSECFQMDSQLALHRLKHRVEPTFSTQALAYLQNAQLTVQVKVRIEENGNVTVLESSGGNGLVANAVRAAVAGWKFTPAMDDKGPRCVNTQLPIVITRR